MATIEKRGSYQWRARIRKRGYPTETRTFETKVQAETWARKIESEMDYGVFVSRAEAEYTTFGDLIQRYRDEVTSRKKGRDVETTRLNAIRKHPIFSQILSTISSYDIAAYRDERLQQVSSSTVLKEITLLGQAIDIGIKEWGLYLPANPVRTVRRPSPARARERRLMPDEEDRLMKAIDEGSRNQWLKPIVLFALETGMRRGELLGLTWTRVDLGLRTAKLVDTKKRQLSQCSTFQRRDSNSKIDSAIDGGQSFFTFGRKLEASLQTQRGPSRNRELYLSRLSP